MNQYSDFGGAHEAIRRPSLFSKESELGLQIGDAVILNSFSCYRKHYGNQEFNITGFDRKMVNIKYVNKFGDTRAITVPRNHIMIP